MESWMQMIFMIDGNKTLRIDDIDKNIGECHNYCLEFDLYLSSVETNKEVIPKYIDIFYGYEYNDITLQFMELP